MLRNHRRLGACCALLLGGALVGGPRAAAFNVGNSALPSPFPMVPPNPNPDPNLAPTDFHSSPPETGDDWKDESTQLPWPNGPNGEPRTEPSGPPFLGHDYNPTKKEITIQNVHSATRIKTVWMHLQFNTGVPPQPPGAPFDQNRWGSLSTVIPATVTPTGASVEQFSGSNVIHVYQTWQITPQIQQEFIDISKLLTAMGRPNPDFIWTQTICQVPEPAAAALASAALVVLARVRRQCRQR